MGGHPSGHARARLGEPAGCGQPGGPILISRQNWSVSFDDLPEGWQKRPLTDPRLVADVLDLVVSDADRLAGGLAVLLCDERGRLVQPGVISELDFDSSEAERSQMLSIFVTTLAPHFESILFALARADGLSITADDQSWARAVQHACRGEVRLLGFHLVTRDGSRLLPGTCTAA